MLICFPISFLNFANLTLYASTGALAAFLIDALSALVIRRLTPKSWYAPNSRLFTVSKRERDLYSKLRIKKWKDYVPELGGFTDFHKDRLESMSDREYLERFIIESNYGVVIHIANALLGILVMFVPFCSSPGIFIPVFAVNFVLSMLPVYILRYTSYTLLRMYNRSVARENSVTASENAEEIPYRNEA
jgi:hypothetical protein